MSVTGDLAASAGADKTVRLWNTKTMDALRTITVGSVVYAAAVNHDGKLVASGSYDGFVRVYETDAGRLLATLVGVADDEWLAVTPEGFAVASDNLMKSATWRIANAPVKADWVWAAVGKSTEVAKGLTGAKLGEPAFAVPQP
jgi:WD40 repeat protein